MDSYKYHYACLDRYFTNDYDPIEVADKLREARLFLAEQMAGEDYGNEARIICYRVLYDLEGIFRRLRRMVL
jgi:hypothetical protein